MWCLVNLPGNKLNVAVKTEKNSIAADCLNKVSVCDDASKILSKRVWREYKVQKSNLDVIRECLLGYKRLEMVSIYGNLIK